MKIIRPRTPANQITCRDCDCIYEWEESDTVEKKDADDNDGYGVTYTYRTYVTCPGCGHIQNIYTSSLPRK